MKIILLILLFILWKSIARGSMNQDKILGGFDITIERVPYFAQVEIRKDVICGGSILSHYVILTAAHCFVTNDFNQTIEQQVKEQLKGSKILVGSDRRGKGQRFNVKKIIVHPNYDRKYLLNDTALMILKKPMNYSTKINPIFLPDKKTKRLKPDTIVLIVGLGDTTGLDNYPNRLKGVKLPVVSDQECQDFLTKKNYKYDQSLFCIGNFTVGGKDACFGDSGGPAVYSEKQYGIVSWGISCGVKGHVGVYSNLMVLNGWIRETMSELNLRLP